MNRFGIEGSPIGKLILILLGIILAIGIPRGASATVLTFDYNYEFSGGIPPAGPSPWLTATFDDAVGSGVRLTMSAQGLTGSEIVTKWYFNLDPNLDPTNLSFTMVNNSASVPNSIGKGVNAFKADGDGWFDILFDFPPPPGKLAAEFTPGETVIYDISYGGTGGFNSNSFNFLSAPGGGNGPFFAAAHVQGIGPDGEGSGWVAPVPEPGTLLLLGSGLVGLGAVAWRQRRK